MLDVVAKACNDEFLFDCSWPRMNTFESLIVFVFFYKLVSFLLLSMKGVSKLEQLREQDQPSGALTVLSKYSKYVFVYCCQS